VADPGAELRLARAVLLFARNSHATTSEPPSLYRLRRGTCLASQSTAVIAALSA
jgi:hypothetical protein